VGELERLRLELEGERKAAAILLVGMGSVCDGRDELKHRVRELEALVMALAGRVADQSEILSRMAEVK
jgi:hypothetical protein